MSIPLLRMNDRYQRLVNWVMRALPIGALVMFVSYMTAKQAVAPSQRVVKAAVGMVLMTLMFRFDMVWSIYLFVVLFPFPSGIALGSTNSVLMTLILLVWSVRASSAKLRLIPRSRLNLPIALLALAYVVSFYNVDIDRGLANSIRIMWRILTGMVFCLMIAHFVNDEFKLKRMTMIVAIMGAITMFTAVVELVAPGTEIIPGWIGLNKARIGQQTLSHRIEGIRLGGAFGSHGMLSDFGTLTLFFMLYYFISARNPLPKLLWLSAALMTFFVVMATANRGAFIGLCSGIFYGLYVFRSRLNIVRMVMITATLVAVFLGAELALDQFEYGVSLTDRLLKTEFEGVVPDSRTGTWVPTIMRAMDHFFIGHGPWFDTGVALDWHPWPHNGYLFYFHSVGVLGLAAFLFVVWRVFQLSRSYTRPVIQGTYLADISRILHIQLIVLLIVQLRTDHQRDDIYIYILWMIFGMVAAAANIIRKKEKEAAVLLTGERALE